jgi:peptide/nickel transport system ATP-binding protein
MVEGGSSEVVTQHPAHPYTQLLISSAPDPDRILGLGTPDDTEDSSGGEPPSLIDPPAGCRFHPRCPSAMDVCRTELPPRFDVPVPVELSATVTAAAPAAADEPLHWAACWLFDETRALAPAGTEASQ